MLAGRAHVVLLAAALSACSAPPAQDPGATLRDYAAALEQGRADDAYRLLSDEARRGTSLEAFRRMVKDNPDEAREMGRALDRHTSSPVVTATLTGADGQELHLVLEGGKWKLDGAAIDLYAQDTPRHTIQGFLRALERKRYDVLVKYASDQHREGLDANTLREAWEKKEHDQIEQLVVALKQALPTAPIEEAGERATMPYGSGVSLQLVREHGLWKIENLE
jgi:hypothetical protein